jgi:dTDP-4-dehydrorhamnose reductase
MRNGRWWSKPFEWYTDKMRKSKLILVVGSSGFLGQQIVKQLESETTVLKTHYRNACYPDSIRYDFFNDDIGHILDKQQVEVVIFASSVEMNNQTNNVEFSMARFARSCAGRRLIYLSSDALFDGQKGGYTEKDSPNPQSLYGKNLAICEELITGHCHNFCIIRPSYLYGFSNGNLDSRLAKTKSLLESGNNVVLFKDMFKSPLGVKQMAQAVIDLSFLDYNGIVHVAGHRLSVYEFHLQAMAALNINSANITSCPMPTNKGFLRDTSLDSSLWQTLTGTVPYDVEATLLQYDRRNI